MEFMDKLNAPQREAVLHGAGPMIVFAGAGTGKTRIITYRIAHLLGQGVPPWSILAVTFTNKAANEMSRRVDILVPGKGRSVWISTFHSFCAQFLRVEAEQIKLKSDFLIYDDSDQRQVLKQCIRELNLDEKKFKPGRFVELISRAKDELLDADSYDIHSEVSNDLHRQVCAQVYKLYQKKLDIAAALDFGDLLMRTVFALRDNQAVREKYQERFRYLLVDEYQDTNHAQYLLTKYLSAKHKNICVVGDDDQSIYSWRGADIKNILEFEKDNPDCRSVKLEQNYRSTPNILGPAWNVIQNNESRVPKKLWTENSEGNGIRLLENLNETQEAQKITDEIEFIHTKEKCTLNDFAVFYRTNAQSRVFEDAFRRGGIPYTIIGSLRFYERAEVKDILGYMRLVHNPDDDVSFRRVINSPKRGIGKSSVETLADSAREKGVSLWAALESIGGTTLSGGAMKRFRDFRILIEGLRSEKDAHTVLETAKNILEKTAYIKELEQEDSIEAQGRIENIYELINAITEFEKISPDRSLGGYLTSVSLVSDLDDLKDDASRVTLMTLHLAKGLEFKTVFIAGLEEGLFPMGEASFDKEEIEEERRLMYVGMTRAKEYLYLSWASERRVFGKTRWNLPSRFIEEAGLEVKSRTAPAADLRYAAVTSSSDGNGTDLKLFARHLEEDLDIVQEHGPYCLGSRVRHDQFGEGKIIDKSGQGEELKLVVLFDSGQWKKLLVKYANLQAIQ